MANTTVKTTIDNVKLILQETTTNGIRWTNAELIKWLNEAYQKIVLLKPNANSKNATMTCVAGTKQSLPVDGVYLLDVVRNKAGDSSAVTPTERRYLDNNRRGWHGEAGSETIDHYMYDDQDQKNFYVYPPATSAAQLEFIYATVPAPHPEVAATDGTTTISLDDRYEPVLVDYILMRSYTKDADYAGNAERQRSHEGAFMSGLGLSAQAESSSSPNNPANR